MQHNLNVDSHEIAKFSALADQWWDQKGEFKTLHDINPLRLEFIKQHCDLKNKKILDVGCGGGILSESLAIAGGIVTGIDMSESALNAARLHLKNSNLNINYHCMTVEELAEQQPEKFDFVTCMELLEHVPDPEMVVKSCAKLINSQGVIFFSTLNRTPKSYLFAIMGAEYILQLLPKGTHDYAKFIRPSELLHWAEASQLELQKLSGLSYNPLLRNYKLSDDLAVNYLACYRKASYEK